MQKSGRCYELATLFCFRTWDGVRCGTNAVLERERELDTTFGGTLEVHFVDGFAPIKGHGFDLINVETNAFGNLTPVNVIGLQAGFQPQLPLARGVLRLTALNDGVAT